MNMTELDEASEKLTKANKELLEAEEKLMGKEIMPCISTEAIHDSVIEAEGYADSSLIEPRIATVQRDADLKRHYEIVEKIWSMFISGRNAHQRRGNED